MYALAGRSKAEITIFGKLWQFFQSSSIAFQPFTVQLLIHLGKPSFLYWLPESFYTAYLALIPNLKNKLIYSMY